MGGHGSRLHAVQGVITEAVYGQIVEAVYGRFKGRSRKPFTGGSRGDHGNRLRAVLGAIAEAVYGLAGFSRYELRLPFLHYM